MLELFCLFYLFVIVTYVIMMAAPGDFDVRVFEVEDLRIKKLRRENKLEKKRTKKVELFWVFFSQWKCGR